MEQVLFSPIVRRALGRNRTGSVKLVFLYDVQPPGGRSWHPHPNLHQNDGDLNSTTTHNLLCYRHAFLKSTSIQTRGFVLLVYGNSRSLGKRLSVKPENKRVQSEISSTASSSTVPTMTSPNQAAYANWMTVLLDN